MNNVKNAVIQQKKSIKAMNEAMDTRTVRLNPVKAMAEIPATAFNPNAEEANNRALFAADMLRNPRPRKANAGGYSSARNGYSYSDGYYGKFEKEGDRVPSYDEITGKVAADPGIVATPDVAPEEPAPAEEKGIKAFWAKYKYYIIAFVVIACAVVAYKKL